MNPVGEAVEIDGVWYAVVDGGRIRGIGKPPDKYQPVTPSPNGVGDEYIHPDGKWHVCKNRRCPNLVPRSKNTGVPRLYCSHYCCKIVGQRKYDAKRGKGRDLLYDPLHRLYAVVLQRPKQRINARMLLGVHKAGIEERCPEANEDSNFYCPGRLNPNCHTRAIWESWNQGGPWPGACLVFAVLKDHVRVSTYEEIGLATERQYTVGKGEHWRWKDESTRLPLPEGVVRA